MKKPSERNFAFYRSPWLYKLLAAFLLAITLPVATVSIRAGLRERESSVLSELAELKVTSRRIAGDIDRYLSTNQNIVRYLALHSELRGLVRHQNTRPDPAFNLWLREQAAISAECAALYVLSTDGTCIASTEPSFLNQNYSVRYYFQEAMKGKAYKSDWTVGLTSNEPGIYLASPIVDDTAIIGVLVLKMRVSQIVHLASTWKSQDKDTFILNESGIVLFHTIAQYQYSPLDDLTAAENLRIKENRQFAEQEKPSLHLPKLHDKLRSILQSGQTEVIDYALENRAKFASFSPLREQKWVVGTAIPKDVIYAKSAPVLRDTGSFVLLSIAAALTLGLFVNRSLSKPILTIADKICQFGAGERAVRAEVERTDEIGYLAETFNHMADSICARFEGLEQQQSSNQNELEQLRLQLRSRNVRDPLTSCYGRPHLFEQLAKDLDMAQRHDLTLCVIGCAIKDFRLINIKYGHSAGDSVLQSLAGMLSDCARKNLDWIARYDSDRFILVLPQFKLEQALKLSERIRNRIDELSFEVGLQQPLRISLAIGVVSSKSSAVQPATADALVTQVDTLIQTAKYPNNNVVNNAAPPVQPA
jgi:diguanylate cyclase (GGDEF)-like protein